MLGAGWQPAILTGLQQSPGGAQEINWERRRLLELEETGGVSAAGRFPVSRRARMRSIPGRGGEAVFITSILLQPGAQAFLVRGAMRRESSWLDPCSVGRRERGEAAAQR